MAGRGSGYHGCDYNDILHVLIPPATHHIMCTMPLYTHAAVHQSGFLTAMWLELHAFVHYFKGEGANKVADVATSVVQDAILDHMGSDLSLIHI